MILNSNRSNAHTHTYFCDGKSTVEEYVQAAIRKDFVSLGFSIHGWNPYDSSWLKTENEQKYKDEVHRVQKLYEGQIEILCGVERETVYDRAFEGFDYIINSCHCILKDGLDLHVDSSEEKMLSHVRNHFGGDHYAYARAYFEEECKHISDSLGDIIGHIDLVAKYNEGNRYFDETDPRYLNPALEAVDLAVATGKPLEMNTGAISRGYRTSPYPSMPLLRRIREKGGEIMINTDCHSVSGLDTGMDLCMQLAYEAGFDHVLRLRKNGFEELPLV